MGTRVKYFSQRDFDGALPPCDIKDMNAYTLERFDRARELAGIPFIVNSAYRTVEHELSRGRDGTSSHTTGRAMDIRTIDSAQRLRIVDSMLMAGFTRIGIHRGFVHADDDPHKPQGVMWLY